jgi:hypothetical protein
VLERGKQKKRDKRGGERKGRREASTHQPKKKIELRARRMSRARFGRTSDPATARATVAHHGICL